MSQALANDAVSNECLRSPTSAALKSLRLTVEAWVVAVIGSEWEVPLLHLLLISGSHWLARLCFDFPVLLLCSHHFCFTWCWKVTCALRLRTCLADECGLLETEVKNKRTCLMWAELGQSTAHLFERRWHKPCKPSARTATIREVMQFFAFTQNHSNVRWPKLVQSVVCLVFLMLSVTRVKHNLCHKLSLHVVNFWTESTRNLAI